MPRAASGRRGTAALLAAAAASLAITALPGLALGVRLGVLVPVVLAVGVAVCAGALVALHLRLRRLYDGLDRVRGDLAGVIAHRVPAGRPEPTQGMDADAVRLAELAAEAGATLASADARRDARLAAVVASLAEAVVVATESGQVSLVSGAAKALLGAHRVAVGTSLYAALERAEAAAAAEQARRTGTPIDATLALVDGGALAARVADLGEHNGTVYVFGAESAAEAEIDHDLTLHDRAPPPVAADGATPLAALPVLVLDLETTGLDAARDRVASIGAVCVVGTTIYRADILDMLVDPGRTIPLRSTAIHGITDVMVAGAPRFAEAWPALAAMLRDRVVVGHNIAFDLAVLRAEAVRAGIAWDEPPALDLLRLAAALAPREGDLTLDAMAARWGVSVSGRHTALGDALVAAELWARVVPRLGERGVVTLADARAFEARAREVIARQRASGW